MQLTLQQSNWQQPEFGHWLKHSLLPLLLLMLFLLLPKPWEINQTTQIPSLVIELSEPTKALITPKPIEPKNEKPNSIEPDPIKPVPKNRTPSPSTTEVLAATPPNEIPTQKSVNDTKEISAKIKPKPITTGDILLSVKNRVSMEIPTEFQARTGPAKDFYIPHQEIENWLADIPYLDESIDQPTIHMQFYSEGFTGHIEKFFDKITIKKTFTTKYGTKIHCALIGVIAACGWK